ncbi:MAG: hypothetical protein QOG54_1200 [Actinomycetota bacterium]|jgi:hypothetical protein|nr:hypothetical protein [Actinomycetota bacterium]
MAETKFLLIYLNDHLAGSIAGEELAKRAASSNEGTPLGDYLDTFISEINEERGLVERTIEELGGKPDWLKGMAAWVAEKAGRLKLNGQITGYSDLSRLVELEGLVLGVTGKLGMYRVLHDIRNVHPAVATVEWSALIERAEGQRARLEEFRLGAARIAFTEVPVSAAFGSS